MSSHSYRLPPTATEHSIGTMYPSVVAVAVEHGPRRARARVRGQIDMEDADGLREKLAAALSSSRDGLDVDLSAVTFCDSSGLHVLLDLDRLASGTGKSLVLTALSRPVARLLRLTGSQSLLRVRGRPAPALASPVPAGVPGHRLQPSETP